MSTIKFSLQQNVLNINLTTGREAKALTPDVLSITLKQPLCEITVIFLCKHVSTSPGHG